MLKPVKVYDALAVLRARLETDTSGFSLRNFWGEMLAEATTHQLVFAFEGYKSKKPRLDLYPIYKTNRTPAGEDIYKFVNFFREDLMPHMPCVSVSVPEREGDDVIAYFAEKYRHTRPVEIVTIDADIRQLEVLDNVTVHCNSLTSIQSEDIRLYKALVGDGSDNIKGVPGFGEKTFTVVDKSRLKQWFVFGCEGPVPSDVPKKCAAWMEANRQECRNLWTIVGFLPITDEQVAEGCKIGVSRPAEVDKLLKQMLQ